MLIKEAITITGGLSKPSKMPGPAYNLPAAACLTGAKLVKVRGSTCSGCYALKGNYKRFPAVQKALNRRLKSLEDPRWVTGMITLIHGRPVFRWHDSGDIQSAQHLKNIFEICKQTPDTKHWLPTRESGLLKFLDPEIIPKNLIIRLSATKVNGAAGKSWPWTSTVTDGKGKTCPAPDQGGKCKSCRQCWTRSIENITYAKH